MHISSSGPFHSYAKDVARSAGEARARLQKPQEQANSSESYQTKAEPVSESLPQATSPAEVTPGAMFPSAIDEALIRGRMADQDSASASKRLAITQYTQIATQTMETASPTVEVLGIDVYA